MIRCQVCGHPLIKCLETWVPSLMCPICHTLYYPPNILHYFIPDNPFLFPPSGNALPASPQDFLKLPDVLVPLFAQDLNSP